MKNGQFFRIFHIEVWVLRDAFAQRALEHGTGCLMRRTSLRQQVGGLLSFVLQCLISYDF